MNWKRFVQPMVAIVVFAALLLMLSGLAMAQSIVTGAIAGTVTDPTGAVVAGANVTLTSSATGDVAKKETNASGIYEFPFLKPGDYTVTVEKSGFKKTTTKVSVLLGQTLATNFKLELGAAIVTVEVTAGAARLQTEHANITTNFETRQISNLPNPGGDITNIAQTAAGIAMNGASGGFGNFTAFGLPANANLFTVNGNDYNDPFLNLNNSGSSNLLLGGNELQEVAVVVNGYTGQYGRQAGAQIDYTTKSGSNAYHGDAVYSWTGRYLMANDYLNNLSGTPRPFANNNQWAANFGGPIKKGKLFFFVNNEGIRYILPTSTTVFTPTEGVAGPSNYEAFVLAQPAIAGSPAVTQFYQNIFNLYNKAPGISRAKEAVNSCGSSAFTGNCLETWRDTGTNGNREWVISARVDYNISDNDKLFGRFRVDRGYQPTYTDPINSAFNESSTQPYDDGQLNWTHIFSPNVVNSFIGSVLYYSNVFKSPNISSALALFPGILCPVDSSLTCLGTGGSDFPLAFEFPQGRNVFQYQIVDDLSITRGNHSFKMGANFRRVDWTDYTASINTFYPSLTVPMKGFETDEIFVPTIGGNVLQNFALNQRQPLANYSLGLYFQDQFRVNSKLTLTLTMRADRNSPGVCQRNCGTRTISDFPVMPHDGSIPFNQDFLNGFHQILPNVEKVVWEPRFGFAWTPIGDRTVFRGGVGLFTDLYPAAVLNSYTTNFPQVQPFQIPAGTIAFTNPATAGTNGAFLASSCNAGFLSAYNGGQTVAQYQAANPNCVNSTGAPLLPAYLDPPNKFNNPKFLEWNFEVQRTLGTKTIFSANYVGNRGYDILLNNPYVNAYDGQGLGPGGAPFGGLPAVAPDPRVASVMFLTNNGRSNYNGLSLSITQNFWKGFSGRFNYAYSHASDNVSNGGSNEPYNAFVNPSITRQTNPFLFNAQYGPADYDIRHYISANYVWELPFKSQNHLLDTAIGGWTISGTLYSHTGLPYNVIDGLSQGVLNAENLAFTGGNFLATPVAPIKNCGISAITTPCFTAANFVGPPGTAGGITGFNGEMGRNSLRQTGYFNTDLSVRKNFHVTERLTFQLAGIAYNVLNTPNFTAPFANTAGPTGLILATVTPPTSVFGAFANGVADARIVQVSGKLIF